MPDPTSREGQYYSVPPSESPIENPRDTAESLEDAFIHPYVAAIKAGKNPDAAAILQSIMKPPKDSKFPVDQLARGFIDQYKQILQDFSSALSLQKEKTYEAAIESARINQDTAAGFYKASFLKPDAPLHRHLDTFLEVCKILQEEDVLLGKSWAKIINGAKTQAGMMRLLENNKVQNFRVFTPNTEIQIAPDNTEIDEIKMIDVNGAVDIMAVMDNHIFLIDIKGRSYTDDQIGDRQAVGSVMYLGRPNPDTPRQQAHKYIRESLADILGLPPSELRLHHIQVKLPTEQLTDNWGTVPNEIGEPIIKDMLEIAHRKP